MKTRNLYEIGLTFIFGISLILLFVFGTGCNTNPNMIIAPPPDIDNFGVSSYSTSDTALSDNNILVLDSAKILIKDIKLAGGGEGSFVTGPYVVYLGLDSRVTTIDTGYLQPGTYTVIKFEIHKPNANDPIPDPEFIDTEGTYSVIAKGRYNGLPFVYKSKRNVNEILTMPNSIIVTETGQTNVTLKVSPYTWFIDGGAFLDPTDPSNESHIDNNIRDSFEAFKDDDKNGIPD